MGVTWNRSLTIESSKQVSDFLLMCPINKLVGKCLIANTNEVGSVADVLTVVNETAEAVSV